MKRLTPTQIKRLLNDSIDSICDRREEFLKNPKTDFSRTQKISLHETLLFPMIMGNQSTSSEMVDFFSSRKLPSQAAMSYRRDQVKPEAFEALFKDVTSKIPQPYTRMGMHLVAVDGSHLNTPFNPKDPESYSKHISERRGMNQLHLNTLYDVLNDVFLDAIVQGCHSTNEKRAFCEMIDRYPADRPTLFIADRGYASFNVLAHILHQKHHFLIRIKKNLAHSLFSDAESVRSASCLDRIDTLRIGRRNTKETRKLSNYHCVTKQRPFDYLAPASSDIYSFEVRLLKFPISETEYEYILTDLSREQCSLEEVKKLYHLRWGIETAFRSLKYSAKLVHLHSIKHAFLLQEIYAKLTFYNVSTAILANMKNPVKSGKKHLTKINKSHLFDIVLRFLKGKVCHIEELVSKKRVSERPGRKFNRNLRTQHADTLNYR